MTERSTRKTVLLIGILFLAMAMLGQSALAGKWADTPSGLDLMITNVFVSTSDSTIIIKGQNLYSGDRLDVMLGEQPLVANYSTIDAQVMIVAELPSGVTPGDYLLTVTTGTSVHNFDSYNLTIGSGDCVSQQEFQDLQSRVAAIEGLLCVDEVCDDGIDNDCDGALDCDDPDCTSHIACSYCGAPPHGTEIGQIIENLTLLDVDRTVRQLSDYCGQAKGLIIVIGACLDPVTEAAMIELQTLVLAHGNQEVVKWGVFDDDVSQCYNDWRTDWLARDGITFNWLLDPGYARTMSYFPIGGEGFPLILGIDAADMEIVFKQVGFAAGHLQSLHDQLDPPE